ncbi:MAG TPA: hypothetical protein PKO36_13050 [Candidatus Hydrogenedentes bacterium]|nr:hypothetical protein [Candidatus Hydrogenedentota bacterium]HOV74822.1 hypothetical protein [Candidatus Hydrogenedentota bacterium]
MRLETSKYENEYGRKPRGYGYWGLQVTGYNNGAYTTETYFVYGMLSAAVRQAAKNLKAQCGRVTQIFSVEVLP